MPMYPWNDVINWLTCEVFHSTILGYVCVSRLRGVVRRLGCECRLGCVARRWKIVAWGSCSFLLLLLLLLFLLLLLLANGRRCSSQPSHPKISSKGQEGRKAFLGDHHLPQVDEVHQPVQQLRLDAPQEEPWVRLTVIPKELAEEGA